MNYLDELTVAHMTMAAGDIPLAGYRIQIEYNPNYCQDEMVIRSNVTPDGLQVVKSIGLRGDPGDERNLLAAELVARRFASKLREVTA